MGGPTESISASAKGNTSTRISYLNADSLLSDDPPPYTGGQNMENIELDERIANRHVAKPHGGTADEERPGMSFTNQDGVNTSPSDQGGINMFRTNPNGGTAQEERVGMNLANQDGVNTNPAHQGGINSAADFNFNCHLDNPLRLITNPLRECFREISHSAFC